MSTAVDVSRQFGHLPGRARDGLAEHGSVEVRDHGRAAYYVLHPEGYALVEASPARDRRGLPVPVGDLLTDDDFAVLAEERERVGGLAAGILGFQAGCGRTSAQ